MAILRVLAALTLLGTSALAEAPAALTMSASSVVPVPSGVAVSSAVLPSQSLPRHPRMFILVIGVAAVLVTFQRALTVRRKGT
jgi:hypothetical protein